MDLQECFKFLHGAGIVSNLLITVSQIRVYKWVGIFLFKGLFPDGNCSLGISLQIKCVPPGHPAIGRKGVVLQSQAVKLYRRLVILSVNIVIAGLFVQIGPPRYPFGCQSMEGGSIQDFGMPDREKLCLRQIKIACNRPRRQDQRQQDQQNKGIA